MPLTTMQVIPISSVGHVLRMAFLMFWEILWALNLGFLLSAIVQAVVSKAEMSRLLPDDSVKTIAKACVFGATSVQNRFLQSEIEECPPIIDVGEQFLGGNSPNAAHRRATQSYKSRAYSINCSSTFPEPSSLHS